MKIFSQFILILLLYHGSISNANAIEQASLEFVNNYKASLYKSLIIKPYGIGKAYFNESGKYFAKTKATMRSKDPIFQKESPFDVVNDEIGYSILTLTFSINESSIPQVIGGKGITQSEFEKN